MIIRRRHTANFTTIGNALFDDERLAADELGILAFLRSKPHDWEVRRPALMRRFRIGRDGIRRVVTNWMRFGWCIAKKDRRPDGTFVIVYEIRDECGRELSEEEIRCALSPESGEATAESISEPCANELKVDKLCVEPVTSQPVLAQPSTADPYVADKRLLNTDSPRNDSNQNLEREAIGYDRKATFLAAFEQRWPTAATDDRARTAKAARDLPTEEENDCLSGIGPFLEKCKRDGRKHFPAGWRYLEQKPWKLLPANEKAASMVSGQSFTAGSAEARAITVIYRLACKADAMFRLMRMRDGSIAYSRQMTPQLLALSDAPSDEHWQELTRSQAGAWNEVIDAFVTFESRGHLREGSRAPWAWPPSKDGKIYEEATIADTLCTTQDLAEFK